VTSAEQFWLYRKDAQVQNKWRRNIQEQGGLADSGSPYKLTRNSINQGSTTQAAPTGVLPWAQRCMEWIRARGCGGALLRERSFWRLAATTVYACRSDYDTPEARWIKLRSRKSAPPHPRARCHSYATLCPRERPRGSTPVGVARFVRPWLIQVQFRVNL